MGSGRKVLMTTEQVAEYLHVAVQTLMNWRCMRMGPPFKKFGRSVWYYEDEVMKWLDGHSVETRDSFI
jgi:hypothetical protein